MTRFNKGELVTALAINPYGVTTEMSLCIVDEVLSNGYMYVTVVAHAKGETCSRTDVKTKYFKLCTYEEFMEDYPDAVLVSKYSAEELMAISKRQGEEKEMELKMNKEKYGAYELTSEEKETLRKDIMELLIEYDYSPTKEAVNKIIDVWVQNNGWMINLFKKHQNYNGKYQIAFDSDFVRSCDSRTVSEFRYYLQNVANKMLCKEKYIGVFSYREVIISHARVTNILRAFSSLEDNGYFVPTEEKKKMRHEKEKWHEKIRAYEQAEHDGLVYLSSYSSYDNELLRLKNRMYDFANLLYNTREEHIATEEFAAKVNSYFPSVKAVAGQKVSRIVNKVCKLVGIDKDANYNREFAKYSDAINPLTIKRHTILSLHPIDYFTMSFGNSWASCHTIDKNNKREMPNDYSGCYSSGTMSYMLDGSSFVFYTVDEKYNGNKYELEPKINRNMFHMGEDKLIQARVYPQATDGESGIYKQIREIAQKVIADCLGVPNMWKNVKGTSECKEVTESYGTHYRDYREFSDSNVSYLKDEEDNLNYNVISIGHDPICPNCGRTHDWQEAIECENCYNDEVKCAHCGDYHDRDDMTRINGDWYCNDCCFYCDYHGEWEIGDFDSDSEYVDSYRSYGGRICRDALEDSGRFILCEHCGEWYDSDYHTCIVTEDGTDYCCSDCAHEDGYMETSDGEWYPEDEIYYCEHCHKHVHVDDWNSDLECCTDCEYEVAEENEENESEEE